MRILHIGDIVGSVGVRAVEQLLPGLKSEHSLDFVTANAENAESGSGITKGIFRRLIDCGVDGITLGDHIYRKREIIEILEQDSRIVRPANYPDSAPGKTWTQITSKSGVPVVIISVIGRVFMRPVDCPFTAIDRVLKEIPEPHPIILVDIHAEATSDKQLMGRYLDGRVSAVLGTHTHVPTADECILPKGTGFQCDVGMTGPHDSILGRRIDRVLETTLTFKPTSFLVAKDDVRINGTILDIDETSRKTTSIERMRADVPPTDTSS